MKFDYVTEVETDTLPSGRTYHTPDGSYPSITTILGKTANNVWLQAWKDKVGEEEAARISKEATDRGTLIHEYAEKHFNNVSQLNHELGLKDLSMGMSSDYKIAIKYKSTFLRIGSAILGPRSLKK